ncbi:MAG: glutamine--fructose-6-phosphate transaminase (isomerizing), partial [Candidatus Omnitrophica bacterium]|nr:glutamine--fructose-6-phosphate transaminase (isomerizing) [Candidatus Omnitrophota bacterium]
EVIVHLIEKYYRDGFLEEAVRKAVRRLTGSFALGIISKREPTKLIGVRSFSPLILGKGEKEKFLASDVPAILDYTKKAIFLEENEIAILEKKNIKIMDFDGKVKKGKVHLIKWTTKDAQKEGFPHFMLKEIFEQPKVLERILSQRIKKNIVYFEELKISKDTLKKIKNICIVACGTAYHAGFVGKYILEKICRIPTSVYLASEFRYAEPILDKDTLLIAISQSGETADTLASVRQAKLWGIKVLSICNVLGSSLTRESEGVIYIHAGPEISVASTKAYTAQLAILYLFSFYLARIKDLISEEKLSSYLKILKSIPKKQNQILNNLDYIKGIARRHSNFGSFLYLGRNINYPSALEGALKLKEISYIPAEGYACLLYT